MDDQRRPNYWCFEVYRGFQLVREGAVVSTSCGEAERIVRSLLAEGEHILEHAIGRSTNA